MSDCYREGAKKPVQITPEASGATFDRYLQARLESRLPVMERLWMGKCSKASAQGLQAARRQRFAMAEQCFKEAQALYNSDALSPEGRLICKSFEAAAEAYLDYCRHAFDSAKARVAAALAMDEVLENEYGYNVMHLHRVQLVHNLVRIKVRCVELESAVELASRLLRYLEGRCERLLVAGSWGAGHIASLPSSLVAAMFAQVSGEIAIILAGNDDAVVRKLLATVARNICLGDTGNGPHRRVHAWFMAKDAFSNGKVETYLRQAAQFLADGPEDIPSLWYATCLDVMRMCTRVKYREGEAIREQIGSEVNTWIHLEPKLRTLFQKEPLRIS
jgi:hypothetical protein